MIPIVVAIVSAVLAAISIAFAIKSARESGAMRARFANVIDADAERSSVLAATEKLRAEHEKTRADLSLEIARIESNRRDRKNQAALESQKLDDEHQAKRRKWEADFKAALDELERLTKDVEVYREEATLQSFGFYRPKFAFSTSEEYEKRLDVTRGYAEAMLKNKTAAVCDTTWTVEGSKAKGNQMIERNLKLMLRAFNGEADASVARVSYKNITSMEERLRRSFDQLNKLGATVQCRIAESYLGLKLDELRLAHEWAEKVQAEKEEQRRIREEMREEEQALKEIERAQKEAEAEEARYQKALAKAKSDLSAASQKEQDKLNVKISEMEKKLLEAQANKERAKSMAQMTKSGHVYVISNVGSFGEQMFKVGMTRRLVPQDRVDELGDASVPFRFDVHAMIRTENAPDLEYRLHQELAEHQVNLMNARKEFFAVDIDTIRRAVEKCHGGNATFTLIAEAEEYRKSVALRAERAQAKTKVPIPHASDVLVATARERFETARHLLELDE